MKGGFPDSLLASNDETSLNWRYDFIRTYLERDIPQLGPRIPAETLGRFWTMLAHSQGTNINASKLASNIEVSSVTVARYIDLLVDLLLIRKIQPYTVNIKKRLVKSPRIYVRDSGCLCCFKQYVPDMLKQSNLNSSSLFYSYTENSFFWQLIL